MKKRKNKNRCNTYERYLAKIKRKLDDFPLIKCNTEYNVVTKSFDDYLSANAKFGMRLYNLHEQVENNEKHGKIYHIIKSRKIDKDKIVYETYQERAIKSLGIKRRKYVKNYSHYLLFMKDEIKSLLSNSELASLALLSINSKLDNKLELKKNYKGVKTVSGECAREFDKETLYHIFAETSNFKEEGFITPEVFKEKFSHLITHGLEVEISKLNSRINKINRAIEQEFNNQYSVLNKEPKKKKIMN